MSRLLRRVFAPLSGLGMVACLFGALFMGFGADSPFPEEVATVFLVLSGFGVLAFGVALWWLNGQLGRAARVEGRLPPSR
ncbi:hypothetical protein [Deinococcus aestuarii]|uniref:hypothetical protein n=1 Tax=Deinococcus aestuarii TaxID=2774531 RepID=UPI001C0CA430|nr:hypothetical protein [Deinococcus aestuarii]